MSDRASGLVLPLSIVVSVAVGAVIGGMLARTSATPAASTALSIGEVKELTDAIHALRLELERTREPNPELSAPRPAPTESRTDASSAASVPLTDVARELREATAEFVQAVGELKSSVKPVGPEPPPPVIPNFRPDSAWVDTECVRPSEELNRSYLFSTYQQVVDRWGAPIETSRAKDGSISWQYYSDRSAISFWFADGRVYRVEANHSAPEEH